MRAGACPHPALHRPHTQLGRPPYLLEADFEVSLAKLRVVGEGLIDEQLLVHMHLAAVGGQTKGAAVQGPHQGRAGTHQKVGPALAAP